MKPLSSRREEQSRQGKRSFAKGKRLIPTMSYFKNFKNYQPIPRYPSWNGDEPNTMKVAQKPIYEDSSLSTIFNEKYSTFQRIPSFFPQDSVMTDPEVPLEFLNPEIDPKFSSALFLCLSKGTQFFESGTLQVFPKELNPAGKYCMKFYENGQPIRLIFDDKIGFENETPQILRHKDERILMPTLCHKAFLRFSKFKEFSTIDVVTAFTGFVRHEVPINWGTLQFWFGHPNSIVALYISKEHEGGFETDRLFHIHDLVDIDQQTKFIKVQCPGTKWHGRFSGYEEDTKHWTNKIRLILETDPETAKTSEFFWMLYDDVIEYFDSLIIFSPQSSFQTNLTRIDSWNPKESQFYASPAPILLRCKGTGEIYICSGPIMTTSPTNELLISFRRFNWNSLDTNVLLEYKEQSYNTKTLNITNNDELIEIETNSKGGYVLRIFSNDVKMEFLDFNDISTVTSIDGDLPFYISLEEYFTSIFPQRYELIGKVSFNLDQPGNISIAIFITNLIQKDFIAVMLFNNDTNEIIPSNNQRIIGTALTPNQHGYTVILFGLYNEKIFKYQPNELLGKWRLRIFSDVQLSDIINTNYNNYSEIDGECTEMDETHIFIKNIISGGCDGVIIVETSQPLSLTLISKENDKEINCVRGIGFAVLPNCHFPNEKDQTKLIIQCISSEFTMPFAWKLRTFSTSQINYKEDTTSQDKTIAAILSWEKKRNAKNVSGKKIDLKNKINTIESMVSITPIEVNENILNIINGEKHVLTDEEIQKFSNVTDSNQNIQIDNNNNSNENNNNNNIQQIDTSCEMRNQITKLAEMIQESWDKQEEFHNKLVKICAEKEQEKEKEKENK